VKLRRRVSSLCVLVGLMIASTAAAEQRHVLVFELTGTVPNDPGDALSRLTHVVARAAGLTEAEVAIGQVTFEDTAALAGCSSTDAACLTEIAAALRVDDVVLGTVEPAADGATVAVALTAFINGVTTARTFTLSAASVDAMVAELARDAPALFLGTSELPPVEPTPDPKPDPKGEPTPAPTPLVVAPPPAREGGFRAGQTSTISWVVAGAGLALAGTGAAFLMMASSRQDEVDDASLDTVQDFERVSALEDEGKRFTLIGNGLLIGGGAAFAIGSVLILYQGMKQDDESPSRVTVAPVLLPSVAGLTLRMTLP
jgi:hypothetical protein